MVGLYILDTDILSLYERGHAEVTRRILLADREQLAISVISIEEQMDGRLKGVQSARNEEQRFLAYNLLADTARALGQLRIIPFTISAMRRYEALFAVKSGLNVGKNDLCISRTTENTTKTRLNGNLWLHRPS